MINVVGFRRGTACRAQDNPHQIKPSLLCLIRSPKFLIIANQSYSIFEDMCGWDYRQDPLVDKFTYLPLSGDCRYGLINLSYIQYSC